MLINDMIKNDNNDDFICTIFIHVTFDFNIKKIQFLDLVKYLLI